MFRLLNRIVNPFRRLLFIILPISIVYTLNKSKNKFATLVQRATSQDISNIKTFDLKCELQDIDLALFTDISLPKTISSITTIKFFNFNQGRVESSFILSIKKVDGSKYKVVHLSKEGTKILNFSGRYVKILGDFALIRIFKFEDMYRVLINSSEMFIKGSSLVSRDLNNPIYLEIRSCLPPSKVNLKQLDTIKVGSIKYSVLF